MTPFTQERLLFQSAVSPALAHGSDLCGMRSIDRNGNPSYAAHDLADAIHENDSGAVERVCGEALRLEEVLARFRKEAVLGVFDTGRYRCKYYSWGSGPPLVFIHGLGDDAVSFVMPIARLSEHYRCIAYELPRGGPDGARLGRYRHANLEADLLAVVDHLKLPTASLLGCSFGSTIALKAMDRHPGRFPRAVFLGGFARRPLSVAEVMLASWARYWPGNMVDLPLRLSVMTRTHFAPFANRQPEIWQFFLDRDGVIPMEAVARRALILHQLDLRPMLPRIRQPIMIVCGDQDPLVGRTCEQELLDGLPHAQRAELAGCGHMAHFTHPEALAEVVGRFLGNG
jgi:pimeloyl-ACP methyl ester carboxylesterase